MDNVETDFADFKNDETFMEIIKRIETSKFDRDELSLLEGLKQDLAHIRYAKDNLYEFFVDEFREDLRDQIREEVKTEVREEVKTELEAEKNKKTVILAHEQGINNALIATITLLSIEKVEEIIAVHKKESLK